MKNRELIKQLLNYNMDADVTLTTSEDITLSFICVDANGEILSEKETSLIFIEGIDKVPDENYYCDEE